MKKRIMMIMLSFVLMTGLMSVQVPLATAAEDNSATQAFENIDYVKAPYIRVILGGKQIAFDVDPQIVQSRTLVPMRTMFETFGLTVNWDETTKTAQGISSDSAISLTIGSNKALFNGQELIMGVPASIIQGRTMIPLRFFSENMGYKVVWVQASNLILISKSDIIEWRYDGFEELAPYKEFESKYINGLKLEERRYSGINYEVIIYDLYSKDGRFIPNVPDFKIANYIKIKIEEHGFNLETWNKIAFSSESALSIIEDEQLLDGKIINNYDTIFKVTINDKFSGYMTRDAFLGTLLKPEANKIYNILVKDPKIMFNWEDSLWSRLKGEIPWAGMTKDMFLVQRQSKPDKMTELVTKFSKLELWVYQSQYTDSIYYFDNEILTGMW